MTTKSLDEVLRDDLRDPDFVREYLQAALEEGPETLVAALQRVSRVNGAAPPVASVPEGASLRSVHDTLRSLGLNFRVVPVAAAPELAGV